MKLTIQAKALATVLARSRSVATTKASMPITSCFLLRAEQDLTVSANNLDLQISTVLPCDAKEPGAIAVNASRLSAFVSQLSGEITLATVKNELHISRGKAVIRMATLPPDEFPSLEFKDPLGTLALSQKALLRALKHVMPFQSVESDTRMVLCGPCFSDDDGKAVIVATSGRALRMEATDQPFTAGGIVPSTGASLILSGCDDSETTATLTFSESLFSCVSGNWAVIGKLIEGQYPNWKQVIPPKGKHTMTFDRDRLLSALAIVAVAAGEDVPRVKISGTAKSLTITAVDASGLSSNEDVEGGSTTLKEPVAYSVNLLRDFVESFDTDDLTMTLDSARDAASARDALGVAVLMPMRLS